MEYLVVLLAAGAAWLFGAVWYMLMVRQWLVATDLDETALERRNPLPFFLSFVFLILVAGMMRHIFAAADIVAPVKGFWSGLGLGLFVVTPWLATNYMFAKRPVNLALIDGLYATIGCAIIGIVLTVF